MAFLITPFQAKGRFWAMERCEEILVLDLYDKVHKYIPADQFWHEDLRINYFDRGLPINERHLESLNRVAKLRKITEVKLDETRRSEWNDKLRDLERAEFRRLEMEKLRSMTIDRREDYVMEAERSRLILEPWEAPRYETPVRTGYDREEFERRRNIAISSMLDEAKALAPAPGMMQKLDELLEELRNNQRPSIDNPEIMAAIQELRRDIEPLVQLRRDIEPLVNLRREIEPLLGMATELKAIKNLVRTLTIQQIEQA